MLGSCRPHRTSGASRRGSSKVVQDLHHFSAGAYCMHRLTEQKRLLVSKQSSTERGAGLFMGEWRSGELFVGTKRVATRTEALSRGHRSIREAPASGRVRAAVKCAPNSWPPSVAVLSQFFACIRRLDLLSPEAAYSAQTAASDEVAPHAWTWINRLYSCLVEHSTSQPGQVCLGFLAENSWQTGKDSINRSRQVGRSAILRDSPARSPADSRPHALCSTCEIRAVVWH
jgi:hypothetical protein